MDQRQLAKKTSNALERLDNLEKTLQNIVGAVNQSFGQAGQQIASLTEVLDSVIQIVGADAIQKNMLESRTAKAEAQAAEEKKALEELVKQGLVISAATINEKSLIVGRETDKDGNIRTPGRAQVAFQRVEPQFKEGLLGKSAGALLDLPTGGKFEVLEVYDVVDKNAAGTTEVSAAT